MLQGNVPDVGNYGTWSLLTGSGAFSGVSDPNTYFNSIIDVATVVWSIYDTQSQTISSDTMSINVYSTIVNAGDDIEVANCEIDDVVLDASATIEGTIGTWSQISGPENLILSDIHDPNAQILNEVSGIYILQWQVEGNSPCGEINDSDQMQISSFWVDPSIPNLGPDIEVVCANSVELSAPAPDAGVIGVWSIVGGGGMIMGVNSPNATVYNLSPGVSTFRWTVYAVCDTLWDEISVTNFGAVSVDAGIDQTICSGTVVQLNPTIAPVGATISWTPSSYLSSSTIANPIASPATTTTYNITATWPNGCIATDNITIYVSPSIIVNAGPDQMICSGQPVALNAFANIPNVTYSWNGMGLSDNSIPNPVATPLTSTSYNVVVTDEFGCNAYDDIFITVIPSPNVWAGIDIEVCPNSEPIQLTGSPAGGTWSGQGIDASGLFAPLDEGSYTVTYSYINPMGCESNDSVSVDVVYYPSDCGIFGCTDSEACNFNVDANQEDGSCIYPEDGDLNCDGIIEIGDVLQFLEIFGCVGSPECEDYDLDGDGVVGVSDIIILLGNM